MQDNHFGVVTLCAQIGYGCSMISSISLTIHFCLGAVAQRCSVKKVLLEISQNSQESTCVRPLF